MAASFSVSLRIVFSLMWRAFSSALADNCFTLARAAAYSSALAVFPGMLFVAALVFGSDRFGANAVNTLEQLTVALGQMLPTDVHLLLADYLTVPQQVTRRILFGAAFAAVAFAADTMIILMQGFRAAYREPHTGSYWSEYGLAIALVFLISVPITVASVVMVFGHQIGLWLVSIFGQPEWLRALLGASWWAFSVVAIWAALSLLYRVAPSRHHGWADVWEGALLATLFWVPMTALFAFYVQNVARYTDLYGSVSTVMVLLIWMYLLDVIVLIGSQFNAELTYFRSEGVFRPPKGAAA